VKDTKELPVGVDKKLSGVEVHKRRVLIQSSAGKKKNSRKHGEAIGGRKERDSQAAGVSGKADEGGGSWHHSRYNMIPYGTDRARR